MSTESSESDCTPPTVGLAKGAVAAAREYVQKNKLSDQDREAILEKAQELESALDDMSPVQGRNHISWYEAPSPEANTQYQELMNFLGKKNITLEVKVEEDLAL